MNTIKFQNKEFKIREVNIPEIGNVLISVNSLNKLLMNEDGGYNSNEAITADENIFCFIEDYEMKLSDVELINIITKEIK